MVRELLFKRRVLVRRSLAPYIGPCRVGDSYLVDVVMLGRADDRFVLALEGSLSDFELCDLRRIVEVVRCPKDGILEVRGLALARPLIVASNTGRDEPWLYLDVYNRNLYLEFKPRCTPPLGGSRWWVYNWCEDCDFVAEEGLTYQMAARSVYVLKEGGISMFCKECDQFYYNIYSLCKFAFGGGWLFWSPVGQPVSAPGAGSLTGAELPVVRRKDGYLRVGSWLAWHRVLGTLDDGRWVLIGDDGLYRAVFKPTVKNPLEVFGEVGYVRVAGPYRGDVDDVQSPCGAPRLVACVEETRNALAAAGHRCEAEGGVPHVLLGEGRVLSLGREVLDWPLADTCAPLLKLGDYSLLDWRL
jgi:hypothetical protein